MINNLYSNFTFGFGSDMSMARYFDSLPEELKRAAGRHDFRTLEELKRFVQQERQRR